MPGVLLRAGFWVSQKFLLFYFKLLFSLNMLILKLHKIFKLPWMSLQRIFKLESFSISSYFQVVDYVLFLFYMFVNLLLITYASYMGAFSEAGQQKTKQINCLSGA